MSTYLHLTVNSIASANRTWATAEATIVPIGTSLTVWAVASHMASIATDTANDVRGEVALLRAVILAMSDLTTCLRSLKRVL